MRISEITKVIEAYAPETLAESYDNVGLILGDREREAEGILLSLDVDLDVAVEAKALGANLIISHHPLIFNPVKRITVDTPEGKCLLFLAENQIAVYSAHTNLDSAPGGLNDLAAQFLQLNNTFPLDGTEEAGIGRVGVLPHVTSLRILAEEIKKLYRLPAIRVIGDVSRAVQKIALCTGSGGSLLDAAIEKGADVYITGDLKYNVAREADAKGLSVIELGHYESEFIVTDLIEKILEHYLPGACPVYKSKANKNVFKWV